MFKHALVRPPGRSFVHGLTEAALGTPDIALALEQHQRYCAALVHCGLTVLALEPDEAFPDSTFVEDTALIFPEGAILCRPGAPSRQAESEAMEREFDFAARITDPGTVDGGDVCVADRTVFIGLSERTNEEGARQLAEFLSAWGYEPVTVPLGSPRTPGILHLKSGMSYLGDGVFVLDNRLGEVIVGRPHQTPIMVHPEEAYAANCVLVNDKVLIASGFPKLARSIVERGFQTIELPMSEFQKLDGGLSCLSLRW